MGRKFIGIDYGTKRVGVSVSDEYGKMAFPKTILSNDRNLLRSIKHICSEEDISEIVIGESLDYKGAPNPVMKDINKLKETLEKEISIPVHLEPEFMTSAQAARTPEKMRRGDNCVQDNSNKLDASAAAIILQSFLDKK